MRLPKELGLGAEVVGRLVRCCYGTRDAGAIWETFFSDALVSMGFVQGKASPCTFHHPDWDVSVVVHGDDFAAAGAPSSLDQYGATLMKYVGIKLRGRHGEHPGDQKEVRLLNRILRIVPEGILYEGDPRHVELLERSLGLQHCKPYMTPGAQWTGDPANANDLEEVEPVDAVPVASVTARDRSTMKHMISDGCIRAIKQEVLFNDAPETIDVRTPCSVQFGEHPSTAVLVGPLGSLAARSSANDADRYTGFSLDALAKKDASGTRKATPCSVSMACVQFS